MFSLHQQILQQLQQVHHHSMLNMQMSIQVLMQLVLLHHLHLNHRVTLVNKDLLVIQVYESVHGGNAGYGGGYEASSFSSQGGAVYGDGNASSYQGYNNLSGSNPDLASAAFNAADLNRDGSIDQNEFQQYFNSNNQ